MGGFADRGRCLGVLALAMVADFVPAMGAGFETGGEPEPGPTAPPAAALETAVVQAFARLKLPGGPASAGKESATTWRPAWSVVLPESWPLKSDSVCQILLYATGSGAGAGRTGGVWGRLRLGAGDPASARSELVDLRPGFKDLGATASASAYDAQPQSGIATDLEALRALAVTPADPELAGRVRLRACGWLARNPGWSQVLADAKASKGTGDYFKWLDCGRLARVLSVAAGVFRQLPDQANFELDPVNVLELPDRWDVIYGLRQQVAVSPTRAVISVDRKTMRGQRRRLPAATP